MGGAIAAAFSGRFPSLVRRTALLAPAGHPIPIPITGKISKAPILGEIVTGMLGKAVMAHRYSHQPRWNLSPEGLSRRSLRAALLPILRTPVGYFRTLLGTLRDFPMDNAMPEFERLGRVSQRLQDKDSIPTEDRVMVVWGTRDGVVPIEPSLSMVRKEVPGVRVEVIQEVGHFLLWESPDEAVGRVVRFLA